MFSWIKKLSEVFNKWRNKFSLVGGNDVIEFKKDLLTLFPYKLLANWFIGINEYTKSIDGKVHLVEEETVN